MERFHTDEPAYPMHMMAACIADCSSYMLIPRAMSQPQAIECLAALDPAAEALINRRIPSKGRSFQSNPLCLGPKVILCLGDEQSSPLLGRHARCLCQQCMI